MCMPKGLGVIAVLLSVSSFAQAADNYYVGANVMRITDDGEKAPPVYPVALVVKVGMELHPNFALEGRIGTGVKSDDVSVSGFNLDVKLDHYYGVYAKGILPLGAASPYLLVGYSQGKETAKVKELDMSYSDSDNDFSYGIGVDVPITKAVSFSAEFARLIKGTDDNGDSFTLDGTSVGVAMRF